MTEQLISSVEKQDIRVPELRSGESAIVLQRHERYERDRDSELAGSLFSEDAESASARYVEYFTDLFSKDTENSDTMVLFVSSDTQYAGKGYRSMDTAKLAQDAASKVLTTMGIDPLRKIINLNPDFYIKSFDKNDYMIRPDKKLVEPDIFNTPAYVEYLKDKYGTEEGPGNGISQKAWAMHEMDADVDIRTEMGAEGVHDVVARTKESLSIYSRYSRLFHAHNPGKKLLIWASSHYDTISPLVKDATKTGFNEYLPVDYGGGVVIKLEAGDQQPTLEVQGYKVPIHLGRTAINR